MYELKIKLERYLLVNFLGAGPRLIKKRIYRAAVSQRLRNTDIGRNSKLSKHFLSYIFRPSFGHFREYSGVYTDKALQHYGQQQITYVYAEKEIRKTENNH